MPIAPVEMSVLFGRYPSKGVLSLGLKTRGWIVTGIVTSSDCQTHQPWCVSTVYSNIGVSPKTNLGVSSPPALVGFLMPKINVIC